MLSRYTETFEECLENNHYGTLEQTEQLTQVINLLNEFPDFRYGDRVLSMKNLVINKYLKREIGSETEELFFHRFSVKCEELILKYVPKIDMWLTNFKDLFKFTVKLDYTETETFASGTQNTYYLNPVNANTEIEKEVVVNPETGEITTTLSGGKLKTQDLDTTDSNTINKKNSSRDVLQSVWGKTRANLLAQIMDLKDIYNDTVEEFEVLFMGLY